MEKQMKKIFLLLILFTATFLYAEKNYLVKDTIGIITTETVPVKIGDILKEDQRISIGLNSKLTLEGYDGTLYTINTVKTGSVASMIQIKSNPIKINGKIVEISTVLPERNFRPPATASARASDAEADYSWEE
jgi:hypothetical protein